MVSAWTGFFWRCPEQMSVESFPSGDAEIARRVREVIGPELPFAVSHDFHANLTPSLLHE
jgi:microcystin degradation protein MlrC